MENINLPPFEPPIIEEPDRPAGGDSLHVERRIRVVAWPSRFGLGDAGIPRFGGIPVFRRISIEEEVIAEEPLVPPVHDPIQNVDLEYMDFEFVSSDEEELSDEEWSDEEEDLRAQSPLVTDAPVAVAAVEEEPLPTSEHLLTEFSEATPPSAQGSKKRPREDDREDSTSKKGRAAKKSCVEEVIPGTSAGTSRLVASSTSFRPVYAADSDSDSESD